ncbi:MAG: hypothetical protein OXH53_11040 [bacterium]|nr:hypothetical protein [bacterium]
MAADLDPCHPARRIADRMPATDRAGLQAAAAGMTIDRTVLRRLVGGGWLTVGEDGTVTATPGGALLAGALDLIDREHG